MKGIKRNLSIKIKFSKRSKLPILGKDSMLNGELSALMKRSFGESAGGEESREQITFIVCS